MYQVQQDLKELRVQQRGLKEQQDLKEFKVCKVHKVLRQEHKVIGDLKVLRGLTVP